MFSQANVAVNRRGACATSVLNHLLADLILFRPHGREPEVIISLFIDPVIANIFTDRSFNFGAEGAFCIPNVFLTKSLSSSWYIPVSVIGRNKLTVLFFCHHKILSLFPIRKPPV